MSQSRAKTAVKKPFYPNLDENVAPWPEWQDSIVSLVTWDINQDLQEPLKSGRLSSRKGSNKTYVSIRESKGSADYKFFEDGWKDKHFIDGYEIDRWERGYKVGLEKVVIYDREEFANLTSCNSHLLNSKLMRDIIDGLSCLYVASSIHPFTTEHPGINFTPLPDYWQPWHHVYAHTNAGQGEPHTPTYNNYGMYLIRLYFLGKWRRLLVDDFVPVDKQGRILLPVTCRRDLWFPLLAKALLRVITACNVGSNITVITALTGWIKLSIDFCRVDSNEAWKIFCSHLLEEDELTTFTNDTVHCSYFDGFCINNDRHLTASPFQNVFMFAQIIEPIYNLEDIEPLRRELFVYMKEVNQDWIRTKDYPAWKEYRWFDWAYKQNILTGKVGDIFKNIEVYCPQWLTITDCIYESFTQNLPRENRLPTDGFRKYEFDKFLSFVQRVDFYYLPSQFEHSFRSDTFLSIDLNQHTRKDQSRADSKGKSPDVTSRFYDPSCNSFFLLIDSPYCKKIYFDLMFLRDMPDSKGHIICEKYYWHCDTQSYPEFFMKTCGSNTKIITAEPGRHAYRIWCKIPDCYFIQIFSNTPFVLENIETLHEIFQEDSISYKVYASLISDTFVELYNTEIIGSESHCKALKQYIESFFPSDLRLKSSLPQNLIFRIPFDKLLEEIIMEFILESDMMKSPLNIVNFIVKLRTMFLNPQFGEELYSRYEHLKVNEASKENPSTAKSKGSSKPASQTKPLPNTNEMYFDKPLNNIKLLKKLMSKEKSFLELYPFCNDDETRIMVHDYKGKVELQIFHPFTIAARLILNLHSLSEVPCGIHPFMPYDFYRICIYDVATMNLVPVKFDRNSVWKLSRSENNYIVFALCSTPTSRNDIDVKAKPNEFHWKLRVIGSDVNCLLHPCQQDSGTHCNMKPSSLPQLIVENIKGFYLPNPYKLITKFLICLNQTDIITLQISVNCPTALIKVQIKDKFNNVVKEGEGRGFIFLPAIVLKSDVPKKENREAEPLYSGELKIINNSWKLSEDNLKFIDAIKEYYIPFSNISDASKTKKKKPKGSSESLDDNAGPIWIISMTTENERGKSTKLIPDTREYEDFKSSIRQSIKSDDRVKNGLELMYKFKSSHNYIASPEETTDSFEDSFESMKVNKLQVFYQLLDEYK